MHGTSIWPYLLLLPLVTVWPWYLSKVHYTLPDPQPSLSVHLGKPRDDGMLDADQGSDSFGRPQPSDDVALAHMQALEDIGYRTVGTEEALAGEQYVLDQVNAIASRCRHLDCEVSVQKGSGYHS